MKISIATPMYGGVCHGIFLKSLMRLMNELKFRGHDVIYHDMYNESLITRARNGLTELFLRSESELLIFIDADQGFDAVAVCKMVEENVDILGAPVPMKGINWDRVRQAALDGKEDLSKSTSMYNVNLSPEHKEQLLANPGKMLEVDYVGSGLMMIKRSVFEKMEEHVDKYLIDQKNIGDIQQFSEMRNYWYTGVDPNSKRLLSEDYQFCQLWKDLGGKIYLAPYVKVIHAGTYWFE